MIPRNAYQKKSNRAAGLNAYLLDLRAGACVYVGWYRRKSASARIAP